MYVNRIKSKKARENVERNRKSTGLFNVQKVKERL